MALRDIKSTIILIVIKSTRILIVIKSTRILEILIVIKSTRILIVIKFNWNQIYKNFRILIGIKFLIVIKLTVRQFEVAERRRGAP